MMKFEVVGVAGLLLLGTAACEGGGASAGAVQRGSDAGGLVTPDSSTVMTDDAGSPVVDDDAGTTVPEEDAGTPVPEEDAGTTVPEEDAGATVPEEDAGTTVPDVDAGTTVPEEDAGTTVPEEDAGTDPGPITPPTPPSPYTVTFGTDQLESSGAGSVSVAANGDTYVSFLSGGTLTAPNGDLLIANEQDIVLAKLSSTGEVEWMQMFNGPYNDQALKVAATPDGDVIVTGTVFTKLVLDGTPFYLSPTDGVEGFVARFTAEGALSYVKEIKDAYVIPTQAEFDSTGVATIGLSHSGRISYDVYSGSDASATGGTFTGTLLQIDAATGSFVAAKEIASNLLVRDIAVDNEGSVYAAGEFGGTFSPGTSSPPSLTAVGIGDGFVAKYAFADATATAQWAAQTTGVGEDNTMSIDERNGKLVTTVLSTGPSSGSIVAPTIFVEYMSAATGALLFRQALSGPATAVYPMTAAARIATDNSIVVATRFEGRLQVPGYGEMTSRGNDDIAVLHMDASGTLLRAPATYGSSVSVGYSDHLGTLLATDAGDLVLTGSFDGTGVFGGTIESRGANDVFLMRFTM